MMIFKHFDVNFEFYHLSTFAGERLRRRERVAADEARKNKMAELTDLIHIEGDLTEDAVVRALQTRFFNQKYFVSYFLSFYLIYQNIFFKPRRNQC